MKLDAVLRDLTQGDLLTLGAVTIVGQGTAAAVTAAGEGQKARRSKLWSVTVESELGWYAVVSGPCDIERPVDVEPCIAVAPITTVSAERYAQLEHSEYSPREFPLPRNELVGFTAPAHADDFWPIVDLRYVTSVDKTALASGDVQIRRPLTSPQQRLFSRFVGRRFNRPVHSTEIDRKVLRPCGDLISRLAVQWPTHRDEPLQAPPDVRAVGAAREWLVGGNERLIDIHMVVSLASCQDAGFYNKKARAIDEPQLLASAKKLAQTLRTALPRDSGYAIKVTPMTLDGTSALVYLNLEPWLWTDADTTV